MGWRLRRPALVVPAAFAISGLAFAACANGGDVTTLSAPPTPNPSLTLTLQKSPVGPILATGNGNTLYDFVPDTPTHSACVNDGCVFQWPPLSSRSSNERCCSEQATINVSRDSPGSPLLLVKT